jgi:hypothetical protein
MSDDKLHYVEYDKCVCKSRYVDYYDIDYTDCNRKKHSCHEKEKCQKYIKHIEIQLTNVTKNNAEYVTSLQKQLTDIQKRLFDLENAIKYAPNGEVYVECKNEFEQLKQL